jgi:hypothetical protein
MEVSREMEISDVRAVRPHLVILGAGASRAALPRGDATGRRLPLMIDLVETIGLESLLARFGIDWTGRNFEDVYAELANDTSTESQREELESAIYQYFASLALPNVPTIYDQLILSLRDKDVIATFNWDPFLIQAYRRSGQAVNSLPQLIFLHGNALAGYCTTDNVLGVRGARCPLCGQPFTPSKLLYPIREKNYSADRMIANAWAALKMVLKDALVVTIFGYSAPKSDVEAIELMSTAWGQWRNRQFEQFEFIDLKTRE